MGVNAVMLRHKCIQMDKMSLVGVSRQRREEKRNEKRFSKGPHRPFAAMWETFEVKIMVF